MLRWILQILQFKWIDHGKVIQSVPNRDFWNAIDPNLIVDENQTGWLNFGSFWGGIKMVKLNADYTAVDTFRFGTRSPKESEKLCPRR